MSILIYNQKELRTYPKPKQKRHAASSTMNRLLKNKPRPSIPLIKSWTQRSSFWCISQAISCMKMLTSNAATSRVTTPITRKCFPRDNKNSASQRRSFVIRLEVSSSS